MVETGVKVFAFTLAVLVLTGCGENRGAENVVDAQGVTVETSEDILEQVRGGCEYAPDETERAFAEYDFYSCVSSEEGFELTFYSYANELFFYECYPMEPGIRRMTDCIFEVRLSVGSPAAYVFYVDIENEEVSETFFNAIFFGARYVAYMEDGQLILRDIFDKDLLYMAVLRDFSKCANPMSAIISVESIKDIKIEDEEIVVLTYYSGDDYEEISERIVIPKNSHDNLSKSTLREGSDETETRLPHSFFELQTKETWHGNIEAWIGYEYDRAGNKMQRMEITSYPNEWGEREYDSAGNQIKYTEYDIGGGVLHWLEWEYDSAGNLTKETEYDSDGWIRHQSESEYDSVGNEIKRTEYYNGICWWNESEYDCAGNCIKWTQYNADGSVRNYQIFEYDSAGNQTKVIWYKWSGWDNRKNECIFHEWYEYEYDSAGNVIKCTWYNEDGSLIKSEYYSAI